MAKRSGWARWGKLWLVAYRALRDVPRIAVVWEFLVAEVRRLGIRPGDDGRPSEKER